MSQELLSIGEAAKKLGISIDTLRRWDKSGRLPSFRPAPDSHRRYRLEDIELFTKDLFYLAKKWASDDKAREPEKDYYCPNSYVFKVRLDKLEALLSEEKSLQDIFSLISSIVGEIGNNSFDHNLGNWPDVPGVFFAYDLNKKTVVLADRGQGILKTLRRARPKLKKSYRSYGACLYGNNNRPGSGTQGERFEVR